MGWAEASAWNGVVHLPEKEMRLRSLEVQADQACAAMYDAPFDTTGRYSDAQEFLADAIALANELGLAEEATRLSRKLAHIKAVFRSQFS